MMHLYEQSKKAFVVSVENLAYEEWENLSFSQREVYKDKFEFAEVRTREAIHQIAVFYGLMK